MTVRGIASDPSLPRRAVAKDSDTVHLHRRRKPRSDTVRAESRSEGLPSLQHDAYLTTTTKIEIAGRPGGD
jgi:hypothetical protein